MNWQKSSYNKDNNLFARAMQREMRRIRQGISDVAEKVAHIAGQHGPNDTFYSLVSETRKALKQLEELERSGDMEATRRLFQKVDLQLNGLQKLAGERTARQKALVRIATKHELE